MRLKPLKKTIAENGNFNITNMNKKMEDILGVKDVQAILESGEFEKFITQGESSFFEAKQAHPYQLPTRVAIFELTKDIAAFANAGGGYIVCGLINEKRPDSPHDYIKGLDLCTNDSFYTDMAINGVLKDNIFPRLEVSIKWYPYKLDVTKGVGTIFIQNQDEDNKHFIMKINEVEGEKLGVLFGIPTRIDDNIEWIKITDLHKLSKRSPNNLQQVHKNLSEQIEEVKKMIYELQIQPSSFNSIDDIPIKIEEAVQSHG